MDKNELETTILSGVAVNNRPYTTKIYLFSIVVLFSILCIIGTVMRSWIGAQRYHFYCELLSPGMTRTKVEQTLMEIGTYNMQTDEITHYSYVTFDHWVSRFVLGYIEFAFDEEGILRNVLVAKGIGDWVPGVDCEENR